MRKNFSKEEFAGFLQGNVLKYMLRYKDKNGVEDLKKAKTYLTWLIEEEDIELIDRLSDDDLNLLKEELW